MEVWTVGYKSGNKGLKQQWEIIISAALDIRIKDVAVCCKCIYAL